MNRFVVVIVMLLQSLAAALIVTACSTAPDQASAKLPEEGAPDAAVLPVMRPAPAWDKEDWINSEAPILLEDLRGKVVLLEFSTSLLLRCERMIPWVREWYEKYEGDEFAVIGIHFPKAGESFDKVAQEMKDLDATYPIAVDKDGTVLRAYTLQNYWPIRYLIDKEGKIRYMHIGEGAYEETEYYIQALMAETDPDDSK